MSYQTKMQWGKFRGCPLCVVPASYLCWVLENCDSADKSLKDDIRQELSLRFGLSATRTAPNSQVLDWCRRAALACHPDHGGSVKAMQLVNELRAMFI